MSENPEWFGLDDADAVERDAVLSASTTLSMWNKWDVDLSDLRALRLKSF